MGQESEKVPSDIKLVGEAVVALNISCRNVGIYPRNHPSVELSLSRAFDRLRKILQVRSAFTLGVGEETLFLDTFRLDEKNASYRQFAELLNKLNIAFVTFLKDFTKDELYVFQHFVAGQTAGRSSGDIPFDKDGLHNIRIEFVDYGQFSVEEDKTMEDLTPGDIWEAYIARLAMGNLSDEELRKLDEISAAIFAGIINNMHEEEPDNDAEARIFTAYAQRLLHGPLSASNIKKILEIVKGLLPDPGRRFLAVVTDVLSGDTALEARGLGDILPELVMALIGAMDSRKIRIPDSLKRLLEKLQGMAVEDDDPLGLRGSFSVDDIFLPSDMLDTHADGSLATTVFDTFETSASDAYQKEILKIADVGAGERFVIPALRLRKEFDDDAVDKIFHLIILEMMTSDIVSEEEYTAFIRTLREQTSQFMVTGQYRQVLQVVKLLHFNVERNRFANLTREAVKQYYSEEFFLSFIDSFRMIGSQAREEALEFCEFFGEMMVPHLVNALADEDSKTFRSLLMGCLKQFGEAVVPDALRALDDTRWFVKRNMLFLLAGCRSSEIIPHVRPYLDDENRKVSLEALKCLLSHQDEAAFEVINRYLRSGSEEDFELAASLAGSFRVKEAVADLALALEGRGAIKPDSEQKLLMIRAMGNIGDAGCLDAFRKILSSKSLFFKKNVERMKEEIYRTLEKFSYEDIEDMVQSGLKSKNSHIREASARLKRRGDR